MDLSVPDSEYRILAVRASGPGGQHVNKVSTAVVLRFDIHASSLPESVKKRLLASKGNRITTRGVLVIRSEARRSQLRNKEAAIQKLHEIVKLAARTRKRRKPTKPSQSSTEVRLEKKTLRGVLKRQRKKVDLNRDSG